MYDFNSAVNDWMYFERLLSGMHVANRHATKKYLYALVGDPDNPRDYVWWKLRRSDYQLKKQVPTVIYV